MNRGALTERERVEFLDGLRAAEGQAALGRFGSSVAHALGTPLNVIFGRAGMIALGGLDAHELEKNARVIEAQVRAMTQLIANLLGFAREKLPAPESVELGALLECAASILSPLAAVRGVTLELLPGPSVEATVRRARLLHTLVDLVSLGLEQVPRGAVLELALADSEEEPPQDAAAALGAHARFDVRMHGLAFEPKRYAYVLEPWLEGAESDRRTALALAVTFGIAREHGGWIAAEGDAKQTLFALHWPLVER